MDVRPPIRPPSKTVSQPRTAASVQEEVLHFQAIRAQSEGAITDGPQALAGSPSRVAVARLHELGYTVRHLNFANVTAEKLSEMTDLYNATFASVPGALDGMGPGPEKPYTPERFRDIVLRWGLLPIVLTVEHKGRVVGFLVSKCLKYANFGVERHIQSVVTAPDHRRQGIGNALLLTLFAIEYGRPIRLNTNLFYETKPHLLYEKVGFETVFEDQDESRKGEVHMRRAGLHGFPNRPLTGEEAEPQAFDFLNAFGSEPGENVPTEPGVRRGGAFSRFYPELFENSPPAAVTPEAGE
jgi:ribosomal protein S18 acetylase RimI-like enzyme